MKEMVRVTYSARLMLSIWPIFVSLAVLGFVAYVQSQELNYRQNPRLSVGAASLDECPPGQVRTRFQGCRRVARPYVEPGDRRRASIQRKQRPNNGRGGRVRRPGVNNPPPNDPSLDNPSLNNPQAMNSPPMNGPPMNGPPMNVPPKGPPPKHRPAQNAQAPPGGQITANELQAELAKMGVDVYIDPSLLPYLM